VGLCDIVLALSKFQLTEFGVKGPPKGPEFGASFMESATKLHAIIFWIYKMPRTWFKHDNNNRQKEGLSAVLEIGGCELYGQFWVLQEVFYQCQEHKEKPVKTARINVPRLCRELRIKRKRLPNILGIFQEYLGIIWEISSEYSTNILTITMPKALVYMGLSDIIEETIIDNKRKEEKSPDFLPEFLMISNYLKSEILSKSPEARISPNQVSKWILTVSKMVKIDKRKISEISSKITWVFKDPFWSRNIRSMDSLRAKWNEGKFVDKNFEKKPGQVTYSPPKASNSPQASKTKEIRPDTPEEEKAAKIAINETKKLLGKIKQKSIEALENGN